MTNGLGAYLEQTVLSANPLELVRMLYSAAISEVSDARRHLAAGEIQARSNAISKTCEILGELTGSLDQNAGGEIAINLAQLYDYLQHRLIAANFQQKDEPLAEVLSLLSTLDAAWRAVRLPQSAVNLGNALWASPVTPSAGIDCAA
jgi:flagellar protein FliS